MPAGHPERPLLSRTALAFLMRSWTETNGLVHVALLVGDAAEGRACDVLESIGGFYDRRNAQLLDQDR